MIAGCVAGASEVEELKALLASVGFTGITVETIDASAEMIDLWMPAAGLGEYLVSATIEALKP
jgi:hypothetical protein